MRLCIFTPNFLPALGGTELVTDALAREFVAKGHTTTVLAQGNPVSVQVPYPVVWYPKPMLPRWKPERVGRSLARLHAKEKFDLFLAMYAHPTGYAALKVGQKVGVPTIVVSHGGDLYRSSKDRKRPIVWRRTVYTYQNADGLVMISPYIEQLIREINPDPKLFERVPNGIDIDSIRDQALRPSDFTETRPFALCLGNLGPMKGFDDAIRAMSIAGEQLGELAIVIVGGGKLEQQLRDQAADLGVADRVLFMGERTGNDKRWFLQHCRFGVIPSIEEGFPLVSLEFLAAAKPMVCTTIAAFDEQCEEGVNSFRVLAKDPKALADAIQRMAQSDLDVMGQRSWEKVDNYSWSNVGDRYLGFIEKVLAQTRRTGIADLATAS